MSDLDKEIEYWQKEMEIRQHKENISLVELSEPYARLITLLNYKLEIETLKQTKNEL